MKKLEILIKTALFFLIFAIVIALLMPRWGSNYDHYRGDSLKIWYKHVLMYKNTTGHLPHDLYEVYFFYKDEINLKDFPLRIERHLDDHRRKLLEEDPAYFLEATFYEFIQDEQHWFIKEKYPQYHGTILLINELGEIMRENRDTGVVEKVERKETIN